MNIVILLRKPVLKNISRWLLLVKQNLTKEITVTWIKNNVFQNSENPSFDEQLSENKPFNLCKRKINDQPTTLGSVQSKVCLQNVYVKIENYNITVILYTGFAID